MRLHAITQSIKNWPRITFYMNKNLFFFDACLCNLQLVSESRNCWLKFIFHLLHDKLGLRDLWNNLRSKAVNKTVDIIETRSFWVARREYKGRRASWPPPHMTPVPLGCPPMKFLKAPKNKLPFFEPQKTMCPSPNRKPRITPLLYWRVGICISAGRMMTNTKSISLLLAGCT